MKSVSTLGGKLLHNTCFPRRNILLRAYPGDSHRTLGVASVGQNRRSSLSGEAAQADVRALPTRGPLWWLQCRGHDTRDGTLPSGEGVNGLSRTLG